MTPTSPDGRRTRRAGTPWRILVHSMEPGGYSGDSWHVTSNKTFGGGNGADESVTVSERTFWTRHIELPNTDFDELVIGRWIHIEKMHRHRWWMNIGGVTVLVEADQDGRPKAVSVYGPGDYADPVDGCEYHLGWSEEPDDA